MCSSSHPPDNGRVQIGHKPVGRHAVVPYLVADDAAGLLAFVQEAYGAEELEAFRRPDGRLANAAVRIDDAEIMISQARPDNPALPAAIYLYVPDADATYAKCLELGATSLMEPMDEFYGDRACGVRDPFGITWWIATQIEDVPPDEIDRRATALFS